MLLFLMQHVDAMITVAGGILGCFYAFAVRPAATPTEQRARKILTVCAPLVVLFGVLRFFMDAPSEPSWQRRLTSDGIASAEFPASPQANQQTDTVNGVTAERTSLTYNVPFKDITFILSFSPVPANEPNAADSERFSATKAYFRQQGYSVVYDAPVQLGAAPGFTLELQRDGGKVRVWTRVAYVGRTVYRVVVSSTGSHHDDRIIRHYLESFRIERALSRLQPSEQVQALVLDDIARQLLQHGSSGLEDYRLFLSASPGPYADVPPAVFEYVAASFRSAKQFSAVGSVSSSGVAARGTGTPGSILWVEAFSISSDGPLTVRAGYFTAGKDGEGFEYRLQRANGKWAILRRESLWVS